MPRNLPAVWAHVAAVPSAFDANLDRWLGETFNPGLTEYGALSCMEQGPDRELRIATLP